VIAYSFHPDAHAEVDEAMLFYESRMPGLGRLFAAEIERTVFLISILVVAVAHQRRRPGYWRRRRQHDR
jgi:hypothetical protein